MLIFGGVQHIFQMANWTSGDLQHFAMIVQVANHQNELQEIQGSSTYRTP